MHYKSSANAIGGISTLTKSEIVALSKQDFTGDDISSQAAVMGMIKCALKTWGFLSEDQLTFIKSLQGNPFIASDKPGYYELSFILPRAAEYFDTTVSESDKNFMIRDNEVVSIQMPPDINLDGFAYTLYDSIRKDKYQAFTDIGQINQFVSGLVQSVVLGITQKLKDIHSLNMRELFGNGYTLVNETDVTYAKNQYGVRFTQPVLATSDINGFPTAFADNATIDKFIAKTSKMISNMKRNVKNYTAESIQGVADLKHLHIAITVNTENAIKTRKQNLYNVQDIWPGIDTKVLDDDDIATIIHTSITRTGYNDLQVTYGRLDTSKIVGFIYDDRMFAYKPPMLVTEPFRVPQGQYTNYFTNLNNLKMGLLPKGFFPMVLFADTAKADDTLLLAAETYIKYDEGMPGHVSRKGDFIPV